MADPASILGTAVGITSLGIQACQALSQYYSHFRTFDDDIGAIVKRLDELGRTLEVLESLRPKIEIPGGAVSIQLQHIVDACATGLTDLQIMAEKCGRTAVPVTAQDKRRALKKRLLWPFKQETVASMVSTLDGLQSNVQLAVQLLDLEAGHHALESLESIGSMIVAKVEQLQNDQIRALAAIQQGFDGLYQGRLSSSEAIRLLEDSRQISSQLANMEQKMDMLLVVQDGYQSHSDTVYPVYKRQKQLYRCTCRKTSRTQQWWTIWGGLFDIKYLTETQHREHCEFYQYSDTGSTYQTNFTVLRRLLNLEIKASVTLLRQAGCYSLQPMLTFKPVVTRTSPGFAPLLTLNKKLGCKCRWKDEFYCEHCGSATRASLDLKTALQEIIKSFRDGEASPHDLTDSGLSILDLAYDVVMHMIANCHLDGQMACNLMTEFIHDGNFLHLSGTMSMVQGFETVAFSSRKTNILDHAYLVYAHRISFVEVWKDCVVKLYDQTSTFKYRLLCSEENLSKYDNDCTLMTALYRRSESALYEALEAHKQGTCDLRRNCQHSVSLVHAARYWPAGLRILLNSSWMRARGPLYGFSTSPVGFFSTALLMFEAAQMESLNILLEAVPSGYWDIFDGICEGLSRPLGKLDRLDKELASNFVRGMYDRNLLDQTITFPCVSGLSKGPAPPSYFHVPRLCVNVMQLLLDAGFVYDDKPAHIYVLKNNRRMFGTPLMIHTLLSVRGVIWLDWELLERMIDHGARLDWEHPKLLNTPAHCIGLRLCSYYGEEQMSSSLSVRVLSCAGHDSCSCACSKNGCLAIGCAAGSISAAVDTHIEYNARYHREKAATHLWLLCNAVELDPTTRTLYALAVLRVLTFDELGLTHTCCRRLIRCWYTCRDKLDDLRQDLEEVEAIRYSESKDLQNLEEVMIELEEAWEEHTGTFLSFLKLLWLPLMKATHDKLSALSESNVAQRLGQAELYVHSTLDSDSESESESVDEKGERTLWKILMNLKPEDLEPGASENQTLPTDSHITTSNAASTGDRCQAHSTPTSTSQTVRDFQNRQDSGETSCKTQQKTTTRRRSI